MAEEWPSCFGPYLRYAIATDFRNFESFDNKGFKLFLLVEFMDDKAAATFEREMADDRYDDKPDIEFGPADLKSRYATIRGRKAAIGRPTFPSWNKYVSRVELSLPVKPRVAASIKRSYLRNRKASVEPVTDLLIGDLFTDRVDRVWQPLESLYAPGKSPIPRWDAGTPADCSPDKYNELTVPDGRKP